MLPTKRSLGRIAAGATATVLMTFGALAPVHATGGGADQKADGQSAAGSGAQKEKDTGDVAGSGAKGSDSTTGASRMTTGSDHSQGNASTTGAYDQPQPESNADQNSGGANAGECTTTSRHSYCSTRDGSASENGVGDGEAKGKPCAGCVGKADNKFPPGQYPDGSDHNAGYECDRNQGIGKTNPAHTGCVTKEQPKPEYPKPEEKPKPEQPKPEVVPPAAPTPPAAPVPSAPPVVAPVEQERPVPAVNRAPAAPVVAPAAVPPAGAVLPAAGADDYALLALAGTGLVAAGVALVARRRPRTGR